MATDTSVIAEGRQINLAIQLIQLGARIQVLQSETDISRRRLINLYKEIHGDSPPRGLLPFSEEWFIGWLPNIHSSLFYNTYLALSSKPKSDRIQSMVDAYRLYLEQIPSCIDGKPVLSLTRAWTLLRFFDCGLLQLSTCKCCHGRFVNYAHNLDSHYVCGICKPPSRAGKTNKKSARRRAALTARSAEK